MTIDLTPEQETRIRLAAGQDTRSLGEILTNTAIWLLKLEGSQDEALTRSLEQANRGEFVDEQEIERRLGRITEFDQSKVAL